MADLANGDRSSPAERGKPRAPLADIPGWELTGTTVEPRARRGRRPRPSALDVLVAEEHLYALGDPEEEQWWGAPVLLLDPARVEHAAAAPARILVARPRPDPAVDTRHLGWFPALALVAALGLCLCAAADGLSRATLNPSIWLFWGGIAVIVAPIVYRLCSDDASVAERLALVCLLGLSLYAVKMMRDPFGFTMPDEWFHAYNAQSIVSHHALFGQNTLLPISASYPGLEGGTSALMFLTGMSSFGAGTIVIAVAQLTLMVALFTLFMAESGSWRVAGLGAAAYAGNSNFLYFGAMFSYESLALPLLVVLLATIALRANVDGAPRRGLAVLGAILMAGLTVTHHLTMYILDGILLVLATLPRLSRGRLRELRLRSATGLALVLTAAWLLVVGSEIVGYLSPVVLRAFRETISTFIGETSPHVPFGTGTGGVAPTPLAEKVTSLASVAILFAALPFGLLAALRRHRRDPITLLLCAFALAYFGALGLRLAPSAWEIANRTDEFLFIGLGLIASYGVFEWLLGGRRRPLKQALVAACAAVVVIGGAIAGWTVDTVMTPPTVILADGHRIESPTLAIGRWVGAHLRGQGFAAPQASARTILLYGDGRVYTGSTANIDQLYTAPQLDGTGPLHVLRKLGIRYIVIDRRVRGDDADTGFAFSVRRAGGAPDELLPASVATKFDDLPAPRVYDSGDITVYDLRGIE